MLMRHGSFGAADAGVLITVFCEHNLIKILLQIPSLMFWRGIRSSFVFPFSCPLARRSFVRFPARMPACSRLHVTCTILGCGFFLGCSFCRSGRRRFPFQQKCVRWSVVVGSDVELCLLWEHMCR
ncbi:hypothetical protein KC19_VG221600 [Ceratodon purpureus]|uniref:Uncharacterized protein n=1 Tax=Ceratodon purpureus TaxID=3225 RepID=A0A8T0HT54_CERPU|nr:hypothetical protein KC19_VG221600 [Ceratodon purpureus]